MAQAQIEADHLVEDERKEKASSPAGGGSMGPGPGVIQPGDLLRPGDISPLQQPSETFEAKLPTTYTALVNMCSFTAGPQVGKYIDEVMSHLLALPGVDIEMTMEVQARVPSRIVEAITRLALESSVMLKVYGPSFY